LPQIIQFKRRIPGTGAPASGTGAGQVTAGEPAVAISAAGVADLYIGDGAAVRTLVSSARQVEVTGDQNVAGEKTFTGQIVVADPTHLDIGGGNDGDVLSTDGAGALVWIAPPRGVIVSGTAPATPDPGDAWFNTTNNELRVWNGSAWILPNVSVGAAAPGTPSNGKLWYNTTTGVLSVYNGTTSTWLPTTGSRTHWDAPGPPAGTHVAGDIWFSPTGPQYWSGTAWTLATLPGFAGVATNPPITGDGQAATPLGLDTASDAQIAAGTNDVFPIDSAGLRSQMGDDADNLDTTAKTVVPAINELVGDLDTISQQIAALAGALRFVGNYDADESEVVTADAGTLTVGANLPAAAPANEGWFVIVTVAGTPTAPAPTVAMQTGDWIVSTGTAWIHVPLYHTAITAANVGVTAIDSAGWGNVQVALQGLFNLVSNALSTVAVDDVSIVGDGTSTDPLEVAVVDGGTY
jgi:hypothetical protein